MASKVRVGIVGVGNCASSFVQGLSYYRDAKGNEPVPGLMNVELGGYHVSDVEVAAAFDIGAAKVGRDVSEAIFAAPNNTQRFSAVPKSGIQVRRGPTLDGLGPVGDGAHAEGEFVLLDAMPERAALLAALVADLLLHR